MPKKTIVLRWSSAWICRNVLTGLLLLCVFVSCSSADIRLPKIFSDKMVLQRGTSVKIWGTADPEQELEITIGENSAKTVVDGDGNWAAEIEPPPVGGPYELAVASDESRVVFNDVQVGEVWICSGQSNMQWSMKQSLDFESDEARDAYFAEINNSRIRLFTVPASAIDDPADDFTAAVSWQECRSDEVAEFSAAAYFFATELQKYERFKDVPIGLIDSSWGGTPVESWVSREAMGTDESIAPLLKHWDEKPDVRSPARPASLFNGMIAPITPFTVNGVIWYQGESNVGRARQYSILFPLLIKDWRSRFENGDIAFLYVQLAPYRYDKDPRELAELWDAQLRALQTPNTGMAGSSDIGEPGDIHPKNKQIVGDRLARLAMANCYGATELESMGPVYESMELATEGNQIVIKFSHAAGLKTSGESLEGFQICGKDGEFKPASAKIDGETVIVWSDDVKDPAHVRFLWDDTAVATLFNESELPAFPFRTDDFELLSADRDF